MSKAESSNGDGPGQSGRDPLTGVFLAMRDTWLEGVAAMAAGRTFNQATGGQDNAMAADFMLPVGHAMMIAANRSISYWLNLAQILARHQANSIRAAGAKAIGAGGAGAAQLPAQDELRAVLREVGDLTAREARLLQHEFGVLSESLTQPSQPPDLSAPYRRRWRVKA
jgi:hypothetical protein